MPDQYVQSQSLLLKKARLVQLHLIEGLGDTSLRRLMVDFTDPDQIWEKVQRRSLPNYVSSRNKELCSRIDLKEAITKVEKAWSKSIRIIAFGDKEYPASIAEIADAPPILYVRSLRKDLAWSDFTPALAVVGTRRYTNYGAQAVAELLPEVIARGVTVVSGMALGIDTFAHRCALRQKGKTVAVLGSGVDVVTPLQNKELYNEILTAGAIVSEFPLGMEADRYTFPRRNRIIAALSSAILVIEAGDKSGALITANHALEQGRDVLAVPGMITSHASVGPNRLIQLGAKPVLESADIIEELGKLPLESIQVNQYHLTDPVGTEIVNRLMIQPERVDDLLSELAYPAGKILEAISSLELQGLVQRQMGDVIRLKSVLKETDNVVVTD